MRANECVLALSLLPLISGWAQAGQVETYIPLHVGNSWTYVDDSGAIKAFTIVAERDMGGHTYYEFDGFYSPCGFPGYPAGSGNSYLFRPAPDSDVLLQYDTAAADDIVRYDFSGDMWGDFGNQMIQNGFSHSVPAGDFDDCVQFEHATLVDCGVFHETLAPGVGTVEFYSSWEGRFLLQSYSIVPEPATSLGLLIAVGGGAVGYCFAFRTRLRG